MSVLRSNQYLQSNSNRDMSDHDQDDLRPTAPSPVPKLLLGAAILGGAFALASRTRLLDTVAEKLMPRLLSVGEAAGKYLQTRNSTLDPRKIIPDLLGELKSFRGAYRSTLASRLDYHKGLFEDLLKQKEGMMKSTLSNSWSDAIRQQEIYKQMTGAGMSQDMFDFVGQMNAQTVTSLNRDSLIELSNSKGYKFGESGLDDLFGIINPLQRGKFGTGEYYDKLRKEANSFMVGGIKRTLTPENGWKNIMTGARPATVSEVLADSNFNMPKEARMQLAAHVNRDKEYAGLTYDPNVLFRGGRVADWRSFNDMYNKTLEWWEKTMPGRLLHIRDARERSLAPVMKILKRGDIHPVVTGDNLPLQEDLLYAGGKLTRAINPVQQYAGDYEMTNAQYGLIPRILKHMANVGVTSRATTRWYDKSIFGRARSLLDIGYSTSPTILGKFKGFWSKFGDPDWYRNAVDGAAKPGSTFDASTVHNLNKFFHVSTPAVTERALNVFAKLHGYDEPLDSFQDSYRLLSSIASGKGYNGPLKSLYNFGKNSSKELENQLQILGGSQKLGLFEDKLHHALNGRDIINREIAKEIVRLQVEKEHGYVTTLDYLKRQKEGIKGADGKFTGGGWLNGKDYEVAKQLVMASAYKDATSGFDSGDAKLRAEAVARAERLFRDDVVPGFVDNVHKWARSNYPLYSSKIGGGMSTEELMGQSSGGESAGEEKEFFGSRYTVLKKRPRIDDAVTALRKQNDWTKLYAFVKQPFEGRQDLTQLTYNTVRPLSPYHLMWRMSEELNEYGLGFSGKSNSNFWSVFGAFALKRFAPIAASISAAQYLNWETGNLTGYDMHQRWQRTIARTHLMFAPNEMRAAHKRHIYAMYPYIEQMEYWPMKGSPWVGNMFSYPLMGIGTSRPMSKGELEDYYTRGNQPMRKGRYWAIGSRSPWWGDKTTYYYPNDYKMAMSKWQDSSTALPGRIRWSHSWMPNLRYPLAPINRIMQPYYYESYHYNDRPYPITGPAFEETTPWGPALNATVGRMIKPQRMMHRKELEAAMRSGNAPPPINAAMDIERGIPSSKGLKAIERGVPSAKQLKAIERGDMPSVKELKAINDHIKVMGISKGGGITPSTYVPYGPYLNPHAIPNTYVQQMIPTYGPGVIPLINARGVGVHIPVPSSQRTFAYKVWNWIGKTGGAPDANTLSSDIWEATGGQPGGTLPANYSGGQKVWTWLGKAIGVLPTTESIPDFHADWKHMNAAQELREQNAMIKARGEFVQTFGRQQQYSAPYPFINQSGIKYAIGQSEFSAKELAGIYGFMGETALGNPLQQKSILQPASRAYSMEHGWWDDSNMGGLSGMISEIGRRFLPHRMHYMNEYNPTKNTMPTWLPGSDYFQNFQVGDLYQKVPYGEVRLPGEAYERTHRLHPDEFGMYGAVDRFNILSDVAPYSSETKYWRDVVTHMNMPADMREQVAMAKRRMAVIKRNHTFYPYHFQINYKNMVREHVHITRVLDYGLFMTKEHPDNPIHIAGIMVQGMSADKTRGLLGRSATIVYDKNNPIQNDTYGSIRAAVFRGNKSVATEMVNSGRAKEALTDWSPAGVIARYIPRQIHKAALYEKIAHIDTPINTKFLQARSPLESYEREQVYGEPFGDWGSPWRSWIVPTYQSFIERNPVMARISGAAVGYFIGNFFFGGRGKAGAVIGELATEWGSAWRIWEEHHTHKKWIPGRVQKVRNMNQYFDTLNYIKYHGMYVAALKKAPRTALLIKQSEQELNSRKQLSKSLMEQKRANYIAGKGKRNKGINRRLNLIQLGATNYKHLTKNEATALYYYQRMQSTLYGFRPGESFTAIMGALPKRDREYFTAFSKVTNPKEQKQILALVPENERRVYESMWHMPVEKQQPLSEYFKTHKLPGPTWGGWRPDINMQDVRVKVVHNEAKDMYAYDIWPNDLQRERQQPNLPMINNVMKGGHAYKNHLHDLMTGMGFKNVRVDWTPGANLDFQIQLEQDRTDEMQQYLKNNLNSYISA